MREARLGSKLDSDPVVGEGSRDGAGHLSIAAEIAEEVQDYRFYEAPPEWEAALLNIADVFGAARIVGFERF